MSYTAILYRYCSSLDVYANHFDLMHFIESNTLKAHGLEALEGLHAVTTNHNSLYPFEVHYEMSMKSMKESFCGISCQPV